MLTFWKRRSTKAITVLQAPSAQADRGSEVREELTRIEAEAQRLAQAIASGGDIPALVTAMQDREHRRSHLRAELTAAERQSPVRTDDGEIERALDVMRQALTDWRGMLRQETGPARRAMQALLKGRLVFTPREREGERFYTFEGEGTISPVIARTTEVQRVWWPQGDSNPSFTLERVTSPTVGVDRRRREFIGPRGDVRAPSQRRG